MQLAMRLDPHYPAYYLFVLGLAHFALGELEEAVALFEKTRFTCPEPPALGSPAPTDVESTRDERRPVVRMSKCSMVRILPGHPSIPLGVLF